VRNRLERLNTSVAEAPPEAGAAPQAPFETTAAATALLEQQAPWLRGAERRFLNRSQHAGLAVYRDHRVTET
jgi:hypothetical protein